MKFCKALLILLLLSTTRLFAQNTELALAQQFSANGEEPKALEIYTRLYKQNAELYFPNYMGSLFTSKKLDEAEKTAKAMMKKHPGQVQYAISLAKVYKEQGKKDKAEDVYASILKDLPSDYNSIVNLATQFYQGENADLAIRIFIKGRTLLKNDQAFTLELISLYRFKREKAALIAEYLNFLPKNPVYIASAQNTMGAVLSEPTDYELLRTELLKRIQADPQTTVYVELLIWQFMQQKEYDQALNQALALSRRKNDDGSSIFELCQTLVSNQAYDEAIRGYEYLVAKGNKDQQMYVSSKVELINTKNLKVTAGKYTEADLLGLEKDYLDLLTEFGRSTGTVFAMQKVAKLQAFKLHKLPEAQKMLEEAIKLPNMNSSVLASCKLDLGDIYVMSDQPWEATLIYSQVEKSNVDVGTVQDAKLRNAKLAYYTGDFTWSRGQLDVLKAATTQLIANDALNLSLLIKDNIEEDSTGAALKIYARADMWIFKERPDKAILALDSIGKLYPDNELADDILMSKARIFIQKKEFAAAAPLLQTIVDKYNADLWADDAVFMLGDLYENQLADKEKAKVLYQKIITDYPGSLWINEARKRFRILRGDKLNGQS
ncbi:tetratricopeptide repeat protein [Mucilaginibacter myungsuensis]|uniref:Tetratricopeptide repeat protein n=1 Tax=Mucilaginibacter myungsuensis TaxID=649104 RepID=A0A929PZ82_9SPHI|nr:tetratricopeptide repeat protein [Mucilaginibacter myungsuensis]MBE9664235.1 tetratricopeptide repeat protein [Mucilaginibacter myungsuensis]MDN3599939.1 tetratricopeptide repeat protein [Mucilaginibacter myungsuensis]